MDRIALSEARDQLSALINEVAHGKRRIILESHGRPKAALISMEDLNLLEHHTHGTENEENDATKDREMMRWLEQTERMLEKPKNGDASLAALSDVRADAVAEEPSVYRRERRPQARRRRKR